VLLDPLTERGRGATPGGDVESSRVKVLVCCVLQITSMAQLLSQGLEAFTDFFDRHGGECSVLFRQNGDVLSLEKNSP